MSIQDRIKALNKINKEEKQEYYENLFDIDNIDYKKKSQSIHIKGN
jgi:hypothetical protein